MRAAYVINLFAFTGLSALAFLLPLALRRRIQAAAIGVAGIMVLVAMHLARSALSPEAASMVEDWLPAPLMLLVYWQTGRFAERPNLRFQAALAEIDNRLLGVFSGRGTSTWWKKWLAGYLELTYLFCYPLVPLGIGLLYSLGARNAIDEYWSVVLPSAYFCYGVTAFIHTMPPRMIDSAPGINSQPGAIRSLNLEILRRASIQANTFPSAHVAASMALSFVILQVTAPAGLVFLALAISIAAGATVGRYHYLTDVLAGTAVAAAVFLLKQSLYS